MRVTIFVYTVWSKNDTISVTADFDGNLLFSILDNDHDEQYFNGECWEFEEWAKSHELNTRVDEITLNLDNKTIESWA